MKKLTAFLLLCFIIFASVLLPAKETKAEGAWPECADIVAEAGILLDADSGAILYDKNANQKMYPASITKIITAMVAIEKCSLDETVTFSEKAVTLEPGDATLGFVAGEQISLRDCLYGLLLYSANECANAIAEHVAGSYDEFAKLMNAYAKECGAINTNFTNPSGLFDANHYTTCYDMAQMSNHALKNSTYISIDGTTSYTIGATNKSSTPREIYHRHKMLFSTNEVYYEGAIGGKTGYLDEAGRTLVTFASKEGKTLISVVMKSTTEAVYPDTATLLDYGFNNFHSIKVADNETKFSTEASVFAGSFDLARIDTSSLVTIPSSIAFSDLTLEYNMVENEDYFALLKYYYGSHYVGSAKLSIAKSTTESPYAPALPIEESSIALQLEDNIFINVKILVLIIAIIVAVIVAISVLRRFDIEYHFIDFDTTRLKKKVNRFKERKYRNRSRKRF
ncbi:MAG: D-alanyl-D-alanine carboxypeptidase [Parasporobacterium sp.]|nr:D-alanyl-D-alanine carboxypeptidase [Parasporobacterium sp.]